MKSLTKKIVSFSGGKDSTAMVLRLLEENYQVDDIVFFDTGWEFPEIIEHVQKVQEYIGREITTLHPKNDFIYTMTQKPLKSGRTGYGWPAPIRRWCTAEKRDGIKKYTKQFGGAEQYIGFAADEVKRTGCGNGCSGERVRGVTRLYPLIFDWDMDEAACLQYCRDRGFDWGGLYDHLGRVSCFCCPLQRIGNLRKVRKFKPEAWKKMLRWDARVKENRGFWGHSTVHDLDRRFAEEDKQMDLFGDAK